MRGVVASINGEEESFYSFRIQSKLLVVVAGHVFLTILLVANS